MNNGAAEGFDEVRRWDRVKQLFHAALAEPLDQRAAYLRQACGGDQSLRQEVERLLDNDCLAGDFLEEPVAEAAAQALMWERSHAAEGRQIGPYRLLREIGCGGMGAVYLAERADAQYQKQVAIKLVRPGMDNQSVVDRFRHERQILAGLDHPNIAKLLEGGAGKDGMPYFVMDFIEGLPVDEYCDRNRLSIAERLELFRTVCSAVHYAHQNLVIHRDLKPSNILVSADGAPKLLDFGIARILTPSAESASAEVTLRLMTPEYASPEQLQGLPVTTASDVYSLGMLLYRLLTGRSPYRLKSGLLSDYARAVCEDEPEPPSAAIHRADDNGAITPEIISRARASQPDKLRRRLAGDLDNIVLMALRKEPQRRYASVEQFSEDIRRHLTGLPVIARKDTVAYRTAKFTQRHKAGVTAAALTLVILLTAIAATWRQTRVAERRFNDVRKLAGSLLFEMHDAIQNLPGATPARELMVKRALEYLDNLAAEAGDDPQLQLELAAAYEKVGDVQGNPYSASLGDNRAALLSYRKSLAIRQELLAQAPADVKIREDLTSNHDKVGDVLRETGELEESLRSYRQSLSLRQQLLAEDRANRVARRNLAIAHQRIGEIQGNGFFTNLGKTSEGIESQRQALETFESLLAEDPADRQARHDLAVALDKMAQLLWVSGDNAKPLEYFRRALAIREQLLADDPADVRTRRGMAISFSSIGDMRLSGGGDAAAAMENYARALAIRESLAAADPVNVQTRRDLAISHLKMGAGLRKQRALAQAMVSYRKALAIFAALSATSPANTQARRDLIHCHRRIGEAQTESGDLVGALASHRQALSLAESLSAAAPENAQARVEILLCHENIGEALAKLGRLREAMESYRNELRLAEALAASDPANAENRFDLAMTCSKLGQTQAALASQSKTTRDERIEGWREARSWFQRSLDIFLDQRRRGPIRAVYAGEMEKVEKEISHCDAALSKFQPSAAIAGRQ